MQTIRFADLARDICQSAGLERFAPILARATDILGHAPDGNTEVIDDGEGHITLSGTVLATY